MLQNTPNLEVEVSLPDVRARIWRVDGEGSCRWELGSLSGVHLLFDFLLLLEMAKLSNDNLKAD